MSSAHVPLPLFPLPPYPPARLGDDAEVHHGELVADPYRWLEDAESAETGAFVTAENEVTEAYLACLPAREAIRRRLAELWSFPRYGVPFERDGRWFQFRNAGLQDQRVLYVMGAPDDEGRVLLDPNTLSDDGTVAITDFEVTRDGRLLAYATSRAGSDWTTWHVRSVDEGTDLADRLEWCKFSGASWLADGSGFYYSAPDPPQPGSELQAQSRHGRVFRHRLGRSQAEDELVFETPDEPDWGSSGTVTDDGRYLVVSIARGTFPESQLHVLDLEHPELGVRPLIGDFSAVAELVTNVGSSFFVLTGSGAERRRLVAIELADGITAPPPDSWREVIPQADGTLVHARHCGEHLVCHYLEDAHSVLRVYDLGGALVRDVPLPGLVSLFDADEAPDSIQGRPSNPLVFFKVASFLEPGSIWCHDLESGETSIVRSSAAPFDASSYVTEMVFAISEDGTKLPVFVSRRRDVTPTGDVPVLLYGYGGFNVPMRPAFSEQMAVFMERGGVYAEAVLRGGGEYGKAWHDAGRLANKQNVFDDFCACARHFIQTGWSRPGRVAIIGASNGGLLVGACITQHPELFGAAVAEVGVLDMLRFHKFTIGWAWTSDFGDPDDPEQYLWPRAYSPLHHVVPGTKYPPTLITTGDHDDRVVPGHSLKFTAALQAAVAGLPDAGPILLRVETSAGHGAGKPTSKQIAERADVLAFLEIALGLHETGAL
jgi:prolyl oligopeptidase